MKKRLTHFYLPLVMLAFLFQQLAAQSWPMWGGPRNGFVCDSLETNITADLSKATLLWESEESDIGPGRSQAARYGRSNLKRMASGGCATPLVFNDRVYQFYFVPRGEFYDTSMISRVLDNLLSKGDAPTAEDTLKLQRLFSITCDEILLCINGATGETIWKKVFNDNGLYRGKYDKPRLGNNTPCIGDGRIYVYGNTGALYAFDLDSGKQLWSRPGNAELESKKEKSIENLKFENRGQAVNGPPLLYADGVVIYTVFNEQIGFDAATGDSLWSIPTRPISRASPSLWYHNDSPYLITAVQVRNSEYHRALCVNTRTGETVWSIDSIGDVTRGFGIREDYMLAYTEPEAADVPLTCFRLSLEGATRLWDFECRLQARSTIAPVIHKGKAYVRTGQSDLCGRNKIFCVDMETGAILKEVVEAGNSDGFQYIVDNKLFHQMDGSHSGWSASEYKMFSTTTDDPDDFGFLSAMRTDFPVGTAYGFAMVYPIVNGRLFVRGRYDDKVDPIIPYSRLYCYDVSEPQSATIYRSPEKGIHAQRHVRKGADEQMFDIRGRALRNMPGKRKRTAGVYVMAVENSRVIMRVQSIKKPDH